MAMHFWFFHSNPVKECLRGEVLSDLQNSFDREIFVGSDGLGYSLTEGAELYDGWVLRIDRRSNAVVFRQNVNDPTRIKPYRDIERRIDTAS